MSWVRGASAADWLSLLQFQKMEENVVCYVHELKAVVPLDVQVLKWPAVWVLGRYHPKHIFVGRRLPSSQRWVQSLRDFSHKMKWKWFSGVLRNLNPIS
jgi:hypothetical protein